MKRRARTPLPLATLALTAAILVTFAVELGAGGQAFCERFGFVPAHATVVSAAASFFLHDPSSLWHVGGNLAVPVLIGSRVEQAIGSTRFAGLFLSGGLAGAGLHVVVDPTSTIALVGCSHNVTQFPGRDGSEPSWDGGDRRVDGARAALLLLASA